MKYPITLIILCCFILLSIVDVSAQEEGWFWQNPLPQGNPLNDVFVFDLNTAIAVGYLGTVIKTTDGGLNWDVQHHAGGALKNLESVHFININTGWAVGDGGTILKTTDGGVNWFSVYTGRERSFYSVHFIDSNTGWVVGNSGIILKTTKIALLKLQGRLLYPARDLSPSWRWIHLNSGIKVISRIDNFTNGVFTNIGKLFLQQGKYLAG